MNLYQTQHPFYCGIDLHANEMYACVVDQEGKKQLHRNFKARQPEKLFDELQPYGSNVIVGCESTFNWYWLCDACEEKKIPFILGHALYLKAIHGGKVKSDEKRLGDRLRTGEKRLGDRLRTGEKRLGRSVWGTGCAQARSVWGETFGGQAAHRRKIGR